METLTQTIQNVDWGNLYRELESSFYEHRVDKLETFPQWLQNHVKIEYFEPAVLIRTGPIYPKEDSKWADKDGYCYWFWLLRNDENGDTDRDDWENPFRHLTKEDWIIRETDLDHY